MAYKMKGFSGFKSSPTKALDPGGSYKKASMAKQSPVKEDKIKKDITDRLGDNAGLDKENVKKIKKGIENFSDKDKKGVVDRNLLNYHFRNSIGSSGADSVQAVLDTYLEEKNAPTKMKLGASAKVPKKKKIKVSFKPSLSKPKGDGLVPIGKGGAMNAIKSLQKKETQAKTGREKAKIRKSIAAARKEYNHPIYNQ
jgi:hypothetical protein